MGSMKSIAPNQCFYIILSKSWISMSSYASSDQDQQVNQTDIQKEPFEYDYFLSKSIDLLLAWNESVQQSQIVDKTHKNAVYLAHEIYNVRQIDKFRTVSIIRANAFIHILKDSFKELENRFATLFHGHHNHHNDYYVEKLEKVRALEEELHKLLQYLQVILDQGMESYYKGEDNFENVIFQILSKIYTFVVDPKLLWDSLGAQAHLLSTANAHSISLGGSYSYYSNILRNLLKRNLHLRQIYQKIEADLQKETLSNWRNSIFIVKAISLCWGLSPQSGVEQKEKRDFIDCLKGLYYNRIGLHEDGIYYKYIFTSLHLEYLQTHRMFKNFNQLQDIFISVLQSARDKAQHMGFVQALQLDLLPFQKRKHPPKIEELSLSIVQNYIGSAKHILGEKNAFPDIEPVSGSNVFGSSRHVLEQQNANGLVDLLMRIQQNSKDAFSYGGLQVHKIYLKMIDLLKTIYLSFESSNWVFPSQILLYIPILNLIDLFDDIRNQVKRTLFKMVSALGEDQPSRKIVLNKEGALVPQVVSRGEQLQVVLLFIQACRRDEEYLNLPQVLPRNLQTSILYVISLSARLGLKQPPQDQKSYIIENLKFCEQQKVNINFKWFQNQEKEEDRVIEFNFEKDLREDWMRKIYRQAINQRQSLKMNDYIEKYRKGKLSLIEMSNMLRYNHGINISESMKQSSISIKQEDIFELLELIKDPLSVNFDIFNLNLDEEINLNYAHICLGLYNISYKVAKGNQVYLLILQKIMKPYLTHPNSTTTKFKSKYPGFFQKWIYSYEIPQLFQELGSFISEYGSDPLYSKDSVEKIKLLGDFLDDKQITVDQLTTTFIEFSTVLSEQTQPVVYIAVIDLYSKLLTTFLKGVQEISIQYIVNPRILSNFQFIQEAIKHAKLTEEQKTDNQPSLLNEMLKQLPEYMNAIGLRRTFQIISTYIVLRKPQGDINLKLFTETVMEMKTKELSFIGFFLQFLVRIAYIFKLKSGLEEPSSKQRIKEEQDKMLQLILQSEKVLQGLKAQCSLQGLSLTEIVFLQDLIKQLNANRQLSNEKLTHAARRIFKELLLLVGSKQDLMYFAEKLDMVQLILCGGPREEELLIALIVENKHKETQTELLKRLLRDNRKLSEAADRAIDILCLHPQKIHSYHINRLIQINSRYPRQRIEQFLITNLGCERNNSPAKINQRFLASDLSKMLEKIPKKVCEELLLRPVPGQERDKLIEQVNTIFEKLLYLPMKKFQNISLATVQEVDNEGWNTESDEDEPQTQDVKSKSKKQNAQKQRSQSSGMQDNEVDVQANLTQSQGYGDDDDDDNYYRPDFLQIFTSESRHSQFKLYESLMVIREEIDVMLQSNYSRIKEQLKGKNGKQVEKKLILIAEKMNQISQEFSEQMACKMPEDLYKILKEFGLNVTLTSELKEKTLKRREPSKKKPDWLEQFFSDRSESDDSEIDQDQDDEQEGYSGDEDADYMEDEGEGYNEDSQYQEDDGERPVMQKRIELKKRSKNNKNKNAKADSLEEPPQLLPTYSKIEEQMSGGELKRQEIVKLLEIALYMLLRLPQSQVRCRQISTFYLELLETGFGQTFIQSFFTVLRFDQTEHNLQAYSKKLKKECGLQEVSMEDAINNVLFLLKQLEEKQEEPNTGNVLFKESGTLLPIAQEIINQFELPLQNNCLTLLLIYISTNKSKIRSKISGLDFSLHGNQLKENQKQYKLNRKELARIIDSICKYRSSNNIWEVIEQTMGLKVKHSTKLLQCINGYGVSLYRKVIDVSKKIVAAIKQGQGHRVESSHHIVSRLVQSCKQQIKQFYYINKETILQIFNAQDISPQGSELKLIPKLLLSLRSKLMRNKELMRLSEAMFYFLKLLRDQFYGKIEDKMFNKLIHYPKMLIEASWYYIYMYSRSTDYIWTSPTQIQHFFDKYPTFGSYTFRDLQDIFNLSLNFLNLQSFCNDKFKQLLIPVLMKNPVSAHQVGLRFKIPKIDDQVNNQSILVTRKCSFDMAFYQVTGQAISVEFHEQEGSDHGGLVRELMIGWKGRGVGEQSFFIGKILGISFNQGVPYGGALDIGMFIAITSYVPTIQFFQEIDPQIYRSLIYIRDNDPFGLQLRFVVEKLINGVLEEIELINGGRDIELNNNNKEMYLRAYCEKYFYLGREEELTQIRNGFISVVYGEYAQIFTPQEMLRQIRGQQIIDVKMLISKAKYEGYSQQSPVIKWFWSIVQGFNQELMNTFIQFVTGSPKITIFNSNFNITIDKCHDVNCLPVAHTCFNTLDLPQYSSRQILQKKLITAICEGNNSFGIL